MKGKYLDRLLKLKQEDINTLYNANKILKEVLGFESEKIYIILQDLREFR